MKSSTKKSAAVKTKPGKIIPEIIEICSSEKSSDDSQSAVSSSSPKSEESSNASSDDSSEELDEEETSRFQQQEGNFLFFQCPVFLATAGGYPAWPARACTPSECAYFSDVGRKSKNIKVATSWLAVPEGHAGALWLDVDHISSMTRDDILKTATNRNLKNRQYYSEGFPNAWKEGFRLMQYQEDLSLMISDKGHDDDDDDVSAPLLLSLWQNCENKSGLSRIRRIMATVSLEAVGHVSTRKDLVDKFDGGEKVAFPRSGVPNQICVLCGGGHESGPFISCQGCLRCHRSLHEHCCDVMKMVKKRGKGIKDFISDNPVCVEPMSPAIPLLNLILKLNKGCLFDDEVRMCFLCKLKLDDPYKHRMARLRSLHADTKMESFLRNEESESDLDSDVESKRKKKKKNSKSCLNSKAFDPLFMAFSENELTDYSDVDSDVEDAWVSSVMDRYMNGDDDNEQHHDPSSLVRSSSSSSSSLPLSAATTTASSSQTSNHLNGSSSSSSSLVSDKTQAKVREMRDIPQSRTSAGGLLAYALNQSSSLIDEGNMSRAVSKYWCCSSCFKRNSRRSGKCSVCPVGRRPDPDDSSSSINVSHVVRNWEKSIKKHYPALDRLDVKNGMKPTLSNGGISERDVVEARKAAYMSIIADDGDVIEACKFEDIDCSDASSVSSSSASESDSNDGRRRKHQIKKSGSKSKKQKRSDDDDDDANHSMKSASKDDKLEHAAQTIKQLEKESAMKSLQVCALRTELKNSLIVLHKAKLDSDEKQQSYLAAKSNCARLTKLSTQQAAQLELQDQELRQGLWEEGLPFGWPKEIQARVQSAITHRCVRLLYKDDDIFRSLKVMRNPKIEIRKITNTKHPAYKSPKDGDNSNDPSKNMGLGVFVRPGFSIKRGERIVAYGGEVELRKVVEKRIPQNDYCMTLDDCKDGSCDFVIDASRCGNEARFVNDCRGIDKEFNCSPVVHYDETGLPRIFLVSIREIQEGEELLLNYGDQYWSSVKRRAKEVTSNSSGSDGDDEESDDSDDDD